MMLDAGSGLTRKGRLMAEVRIATFNLENFNETAAAERPSLAERIQLMRPQIVRLRADIVCFQEVNGQGPDLRVSGAIDVPTPAIHGGPLPTGLVTPAEAA